MRIDAHVHLLAPRNREDPDEAYRSEGLPLYLEMTTPHCRAVWNRANYDELMVELDRSEIDKAIVFGFPWRTHDRCRWDNEYVAECVSRSNGRLVGLAVFQPLAGLEAVAEVDRCMTEYGFIGVKIKGQMQGSSMADQNLFRPVLERVMEADGVALVHVEQPWKPDNGNGPRELLELLRAFPTLRVIAAHFGGMAGMFYPHEPLRPCFDNVLFDSALGTAGDSAAAFEAVGLGDRIVFASDFPGAMPHTILESLERRLSGERLSNVLGGNILRMLGDLLTLDRRGS